MGCIYSSRKTLPPFFFKVINIDDNGKEKYHGQMEVTACNLILHKSGEPSIIWPLSTIRRYGYENFMFCFEAGRSSPLGQGIFAFRSKDAKNIFNAVKEKLQIDSGTDIIKDITSEVRNYSGQSCTSTHTIEKVYDEFSFNGHRFSSESNNIIQPPDLMLDPDIPLIPRSSYVNMLNDNEEDEDDLFYDPFELPKDTPTYTEVEIAVCTPKRKSESLPTSPTDIPSYTAIDFNQTKHLSQKMLRGSEDAGIRKTRNDSTMSNP
ncbi:docking protein 1 [Melanaphis sacchari]|uniref:Fibroblast growth factor receptor substrate 3 n=1 Tax=Melanaphis sacchari TaxID=742174 RepID=A0A2H8TXS0_9HEMI|nr:docking protein 1 [Melanaphis sacchari]